jgi:hypothetical protein
MKQLLLPAIMACVLISCNNDKKVTATETSSDGTKTTTSVDVKGMATSVDEMNKKMEALKKLTPLTTDQLKALLPQEINGVPQTEYNASTSMGYAHAQGEYKKDDTTELELEIYDCAGEAGSAMYGLSYWSAMNYQQENSREYTKTIDFMGGKAIEQFKKDSRQSTLTFTTNERLLVILKGRNYTPDELKAAAMKLNLKV